MIGFQRHHLVGVRIGRGDHLAVPLEDECAGRFSDGKLRQEIRDARQLDDDGDDAGGLLVDVDRRREGCRQPFAARMRRQRRPVFVVGLDGDPKPFLIGDGIVGVLDPRVLELKIVADEFVAVDSHLAVGGDLEHFDDAVAELVPGEERPIRPSERHPGDGRLRQQLRPEYDFALPGVARLEHFFGQQRAHRHHGRSCLRRDRLQFVADCGHDLVVDGVGQGLADLMGGAPPQQMHADGADDDGRQYEGRNGAADAEAHARYPGSRAAYRNTEPYQRLFHRRGHFSGPDTAL